MVRRQKCDCETISIHTRLPMPECENHYVARRAGLATWLRRLIGSSRAERAVAILAVVLLLAAAAVRIRGWHL